MDNNIEMKVDKGKQCFRIIAEILAAVMLALLLELGFNYHSFTEGYDTTVIFDAASEKNENLVYQKDFTEPIYIKKLIIHGRVKKNSVYNIDMVTINDFGVEENIEIQDSMLKEFKSAFTNINKRVKQIKITFEDSSQVELTDISCSNEVSLNKYRIIFFTIVFFLCLLILVEKKLLIEKIWLIYMIAGLGLGSLVAVLSGTYAVTWDEEAHYAAAYKNALSSEVICNSAVKKNFARKSWVLANTKEENYLIKRYLNKKAEKGDYVYNSTRSVKNYIAYFPMTIGSHIGEKVGFSYANSYILGRLGNLFFCVLLNALAIILARRKKLLIAVVSMMPTVILQNSMYTYDGLCFSYITLGVVLCINELEKECGQERLVNVFLSIVFIGFGCMIKPVYCPLLLIVVPIIWKRIKLFLNRNVNPKIRKHIGIFVLGILIIMLVSAATIKFQPLINNIIDGNLSYGGDPRGGNTGMTGQILNMLHHPIATVKMFIHDMFAFDNFRNYKDEVVNTRLIFNQMFLSLYVLGSLKEVWALLLLPLLMFVFLVKPQGESECFYNIKTVRWTCILGVFLSVFLIWLAMYLAFTPIGNGSIKGVQARYYLPLLLPFAYVVWNNKIEVKISELRYHQLALGAGLLLCGECIYQCLIVGKAL